MEIYVRTLVKKSEVTVLLNMGKVIATIGIGVLGGSQHGMLAGELNILILRPEAMTGVNLA
jgi:hypothetical protein